MKVSSSGLPSQGGRTFPTPSFPLDIRPCLEGGAKRAVDIRPRQGPENRQPANNRAVGDGGGTPGVRPNRKTKGR
jgi:hypothetical protein